MIRNIFLSISVILFTFQLATAQKQKEKEVNKEKIVYGDTTITTPELIIKIDDVVSTAVEMKFKIRITNKLSDYIIYKPEESKFVIDGKEISPNEKWMVILPNESDFKIVRIKGAQYNLVKSFSFILDGLYKVAANAPFVIAPDFKLPPTQNDFNAGNFTVSLIKSSKETEKTDVKFKCVYNGDKIGFVMPSKAAVRMPDSNEYANAKTKGKPVLLLRGKEDDFTLMWTRMQGDKNMDMQFATMIIKWRGTFTEVTPEKMKTISFQLNYNEAATNAKKKAKD